MMEINLSEEQEMLRTIARDFLAKECPKSIIKEQIKDQSGYIKSLWGKMAQLGWMGLVFPEKYGGSDGSFLDLTVLFEELGRACYIGPFSSTISGGLIVLEAGSDEQKEEILPLVTSGKLLLAFAHTEPGVGYHPNQISTRVKAENGDYVLQGTKIPVDFANIADFIVCTAESEKSATREEGLTLLLVDPASKGISCSVYDTLSGEKQCKVVFEKVQVPGKNILGGLNKGNYWLKTILEKMKILKCAEMLGGAQQVMEMTVEYARERVQFGRPIGSFQAIQHLCSNMAIDIDGARIMIYRTAWEISEGTGNEVNCAMAKAWISDVYYRTCLKAHEIFGAIGFTEEHDLHLFTKRTRAYDLAFGNVRFQREIIARNLGR